MPDRSTPTKEPATARMRLVGRLKARGILNCGRCGQQLPTLTYLPLHWEHGRQQQRDNGGLSPNDLYIDWREMGGWRFDGGTLRPTEEHRERRQRAREKAGAMPRAETRVARMKLAGHTKRADGSAHGASRSLNPHEE
jgi:hypothetical protein